MQIAQVTTEAPIIRFSSKHVLENNNNNNNWIRNKQQVQFLGFVSSEEVPIVEPKNKYVYGESNWEMTKQKVKRRVSGLLFLCDWIIQVFCVLFTSSRKYVEEKQGKKQREKKDVKNENTIK